MVKKIALLFTLTATVFACITNKNAIVTSNNEVDALAIYQNNCASCHGDKPTAMVDRKWKNGNSIDELTKSIANGYPELGMPAWGQSLSPDEINSLAKLLNSGLSTLDQYKFDEKPVSNVFADQSISIKLDTIATDFDSPWGMAQLPNNDFLISDRSGDLFLVDHNKNKTKIIGSPEVKSSGQGGLLDVVIHPNFKENNWVYMSYSKINPKDTNTFTTALCRAKLKENSLIDLEDIFVALPYSKTRHHYGSRMVFDNNNYLYFSVGDRGNRDQNPQNLDNHCGKIHRLNEDGSIPKDNPFVESNPDFASIYSYGHRNPQGLSLDPATNTIWETEHGPRGGDELNIIKKGKNYGWPAISYGINYDGTTFTNSTQKEGMQEPELFWIPSIAPSGLSYVTSAKYPLWQGDLLAGSLRFKYVNRCSPKDGYKEEKIMTAIGRTRNVYQAPDGFIYVATEGPGNVYRLTPN